MLNIKAILVDDEQDSLDLLELMITEHCPHLHIAASFTNPLHAISAIQKEQPHLLFLDVEMPAINGFELLEKLKPNLPSVIFVTAYNQFAIQALRACAIDYLLKPLQKQELITAVSKVHPTQPLLFQQLELLETQMKKTAITKIAVFANNQTVFLALDDIAYIESSKNYAKIFLTNKGYYTIIRSMKEIEEILGSAHFFRIHRQYIINLNFVKQMNRTEGTVMLQNNIVLPIARTQKENFELMYKWL